MITYSYKARKTVKICQEDLSKSPNGQSYTHLKVAHATPMLGTPLMRVRLHNYYATRSRRQCTQGSVEPGVGCFFSTT